MKSFYFTGWKMLPCIRTALSKLYCMEKLSIHTYCKVASSNKSCLEAHAGFYRLLMKGIFNPYIQKVAILISNAH